ncbi:MAG: hypothetical protein CHACPFDD_01079 [Phycisphaerae bacterium]|nr:hypothetical protein [Phycisphaerae bacterium]
MPAGQVGLWCSHASANAFDNFKVRDLVGPYEADGRWFSDKAEVQIDDSNNNLLRSSSATSTEYYDTCIVRRGFRAGKYVATFRFKWAPGPSPGFLVRWVNPGDWLAVMVKAADGKAWLYKRVNDGILQSPLSSGSTVSLTNGNWYTGKVVVGDDLGDSALQRLGWRGLPAREQDRHRRLAGEDARPTHTWSDETALLDTTTVDDDWSAGHAGLFHGHIANTAAQDFDDVKIGYDNNADLDLDDAGDSIVINDDFASNATSLSYDDNGNLTDDGVFKFVYDAWNRLVGVKSRYTGGTTQTTFATYAYDGANRRTSKVVTNNGVEVYPNDGGNTTVNFYYDDQWRIVETRNGSSQTTWQHLWGTQYIDELIWLERNGDPTIGNDTDPDGTAGEGAESPADHRYFAHQDRNWNVVALTDYAVGVHGNIVERYVSTPYGCSLVLSGVSAGLESGGTATASRSGNVLRNHGLPHDPSSNLYHNRHRERSSMLIRFLQRDPLGFPDGLNSYAHISGHAGTVVDPTGLAGDNPFGRSWDPLCKNPSCRHCEIQVLTAKGTNWLPPGKLNQHIRLKVFRYDCDCDDVQDQFGLGHLLQWGPMHDYPPYGHLGPCQFGELPTDHRSPRFDIPCCKANCIIANTDRHYASDYFPGGPNSNSAVHDVLSDCDFTGPTPKGQLPPAGWDVDPGPSTEDDETADIYCIR